MIKTKICMWECRGRSDRDFTGLFGIAGTTRRRICRTAAPCCARGAPGPGPGSAPVDFSFSVPAIYPGAGSRSAGIAQEYGAGAEDEGGFEVMKTRLSSTIWMLVVWTTLAPTGVLGLAYEAGVHSKFLDSSGRNSGSAGPRVLDCRRGGSLYLAGAADDPRRAACSTRSGCPLHLFRALCGVAIPGATGRGSAGCRMNSA